MFFFRVEKKSIFLHKHLNRHKKQKEKMRKVLKRREQGRGTSLAILHCVYFLTPYQIHPIIKLDTACDQRQETELKNLDLVYTKVNCTLHELFCLGIQ